MKVRFVSTMPKSGYSGGRLLALTMAEALATTGVEVDFLVDAVPEMYDEFRPFSSVKLTTADFSNLCRSADRSIDVTVIVPVQGCVALHGEWVRHGLENNSAVVLLNFESPNWFNAVSPYPRPRELWQGWDLVSEYSDMVMSISQEGDRWARDYYSGASPKCRFGFCHPGINTWAADLAPARQGERSKRIVVLTRIDRHKGFDQLEPLLDSCFRGYRVSVFLGTGNVRQGWVRRWRDRFDKYGVEFEVRNAVIGVDKFALLKSAAAMYFPTRFEGFGLPPLEAAYCNLPCACSDLPVLREFGGRALTYGDPSSVESMRNAVVSALEGGSLVRSEHQRIRAIADIHEYGKRVFRQLESVVGHRKGN